MTWLRLDDQFPAHPKVAQLSDREFRVHVRVLCWCAAYKTRGRLEGAFSEVKGLTEAIGRRFVELGVWDEADDGTLSVHDFENYNPSDPTARERVKRYRDRNSGRNENRNGNDSRGHARINPSPSPSVKDVDEGTEVTNSAPPADSAVNGSTADASRVGRVPAEEDEPRKTRRGGKENVKPTAAAAVHYVQNIGREDPRLEDTLRETYGVTDEQMAGLLAMVNGSPA